MRCEYACKSPEHALSRRSFLGGLAAGMGVLAVGSPHAATAALAARLQGKQKQVLMVFMAGGLSQLESWDPKPGTDTGGPFRAIETSVPGIRISELLPNTAKQMKLMTLIRGINTNENDHERGQVEMHTGRKPIPGMINPHLGAVVARYVAEESNPLPGYIHVAPGGSGYSSTADAAFLGPRYGSLTLGNGNPPPNMDRDASVDDPSRDRLRQTLCDKFARSRRSAATEAYTATYDQAKQLIARKQVFDISKEPVRDVDRYGKHDFGRHCLMARRLLEAGVTFVKVTHSNYDTHNENFDFHLEQLGEFDQSFSSLLEDLALRGMLEQTLVLVVSEFGRTPGINHLYGRDHWGTAWSIAMAGCGLKSGMAFGETNPRGTEVVKGQVNSADLFHTYLTAMGLDPTQPFDLDGKDVQIADPIGRAIKGVLA